MMEMNTNEEVLLCGNSTFSTPKPPVVSFAGASLLVNEKEETFSRRRKITRENHLRVCNERGIIFNPFFFSLSAPSEQKITFKRHSADFSQLVIGENFLSRAHQKFLNSFTLIISIKRYLFKRLNGIHCDYNDFSLTHCYK
jgi:hypothetical protein